MENASKALIIAGAIILSVLIIGLGMSVFMQTSNTTDNTDLSEYEITQFNQKFTTYEGTVTGAKAMALCDTVRTHNTQNTDDETRQVMVEGPDVADFTPDEENQGNAGDEDSATKVASASTVKRALRNGKSYSVTFQYDKNTSLVCKIRIRDKSL